MKRTRKLLASALAALLLVAMMPVTALATTVGSTDLHIVPLSGETDDLDVQNGGIVSNYWKLTGTITVQAGGILTWDDTLLAHGVPAPGTMLVGGAGAHINLTSGTLEIEVAGNKITKMTLKSSSTATVNCIGNNPFVMDFDFDVENSATLTVADSGDAQNVTMSIGGSTANSLTVASGGSLVLASGARVVVGEDSTVVIDFGDLTDSSGGGSCGIVDSNWNPITHDGAKFEGGAAVPDVLAGIEGASPITITGTVGTAINETVRIVLTGAFLEDDFLGVSSLTNWVTSLPAGLTATAARTDQSVITLTISGTPTANASGSRNITIPAAAIKNYTGGGVPVSPTISFSITGGTTPAPDTGSDSSTSTAPVITAPAAPTSAFYRVLARTLNQRSGPGTGWSIMGTLPLNTLVEIVDFSADGHWALTKNGTWLSMGYLVKVNAVSGTGLYSVNVKAGSHLNVRSGAGTGFAIIGSLASGTLVNVLSIENGWAMIEYQGGYAYVSVAYLI